MRESFERGKSGQASWPASVWRQAEEAGQEARPTSVLDAARAGSVAAWEHQYPDWPIARRLAQCYYNVR